MSIKKCRMCGDLTEGSVGATGIKWGCICQKCKDREDNALRHRVMAEAKFTKHFIETINRERSIYGT